MTSHAHRPILTSQPSQSAVHRHSIAGIAADVGVTFSADGAVVVPAGSHLQDGDQPASADEVDNGVHHRTTDGAARQRNVLTASSSPSRRREQHQQADEDDDETASLLGTASNESPKPRAWQPKPTPWLIIIHLMFFALGMGMLAPARVEVITQVICAQINRDTAAHLPAFPDGVFLATPEQCRKSPAVQRRLSELNLMLQLAMGICVMITTPIWGELSDRVGRKWIITLNMVSFCLGIAVMLVVLGNPDTIPYQWLLLYPLCEGIFGGMGGGQSVMSAYIGDCTPPGSRAALFSLMTGLLFGGLAAGPAIASILIQRTGITLAPFYAAFGLYAIQCIALTIFMPESLPASRKTEAVRLRSIRKAHDAAKAEQLAAESKQGSTSARILYPLRVATQPIRDVVAPIALLGPRKTTTGDLDWSLPCIALASAIYTMLMSIYPLKMQYAQLKFGWSSVQLGNLLSLLGVTRITALLVIIPLIIRLVRKPHQEPLREPSTSAYPTAHDSADANVSAISKTEDEQWQAHAAQHRIMHDYKFDLMLARASLLLDMACYTALAFTTTAMHFLIFSTLQALASGANPALSSLALMFADPKETGKLMAAISVFSTLMGQIVAPVIFNGLFAATVATFPEAFFVAGAACFFFTFVCLMLVRLRRPRWEGYKYDDAMSSTISTES